jgi:hypothetical protein
MRIEETCHEESKRDLKIDPLKYGTDIKEDREHKKIYCGCPCPEVSAPVWAAALVVFDPLD